MTKVVNVMDKVAANIENMDQLDKTASVMDTVTSSGSLTKDAKVLMENARARACVCVCICVCVCVCVSLHAYLRKPVRIEQIIALQNN